MLKGITWYTIFIIVLIGFLTMLAVILLGKFLGFSGEKASMFACKVKVQTYCQQLLSGKDPDWNKIEPTSGCDKYDITEPSKEDCQKLFET